MRGSSKPITSKDMDDTSGWTEENMRDTGRTTRCTVRALLFGLMGGNMRESI